MIPQDLTYDFPLAAYLLFLLPLFAFLFTGLFFYRRKKLGRLASSNLQSRLIIPRENWIYWSKVAALGLGWTFATLAFMQPKGNGHYPKDTPQTPSEASLRLKAHDVFFLIDSSASMTISDGRAGQTRFVQAKEIADETFSLLEGESASLYAFTSHLTKMSPLTTDYFFLRLMLRDLQIDEGGIPGTDFHTSLSELPQTFPDRLKTVIIFSDGGDTKLESLPENNQQPYLQSILDLFKDTHNLRIYTVGLGTKQAEIVPQVTFAGKPVHSALDDRILKTLAQHGSGLYYQAEGLSAVQISRDIAARMHSERALLHEGATIQAVRSRELLYDLYFQIPLGLAILLLSYVILFPNTFRIKNLIVILSVFLPFQGTYPQDMQKARMQEANIYAEAGDVQEALSIYKNLLQQTRISWEKDIYLYNMGVIYLKKQEWKKAGETFQSIQPQDPLLASYLRKNLAFSLYHQALSIAPESISAYLQKIYQFRDALQQIHLAKQADCELQKLEGNEVCVPDEGLNDFRLEVKDALAWSLDAYGSFRKNNLNLREGIPELLYSLSLLKENNAFLQQPELPQNLRNPYHHFFLKESSSWMPLWQTIGKQVEEGKKPIFDASYKQFSEALKAFQTGEYSQSLILIQDSEKGLLSLLQDIWGKSAPQEILQRLIESYQQISVRDVLPEGLLLKLQTQQKQIASLLAGGNAALKEPIHQASRLINLSLQSLQQSSPALARLFFEAAYHTIAQSLPTDHSSPRQALQHAIDTQEYALAINRLLQTQDSQEAHSLVIQGQEDTLGQARNFLSSVFLLQVQEYDKGMCQKKPWDAFLPSFNLGYLSATEASRVIKEAPDQAIAKQEETLQHWKQLKNAMENKKEEPSEPETREKMQQPMPQVLQLLQEMSNDDQIQNKSTTKPKQQIERPW